MTKTLKGIILGATVGTIDVIPMILQKLTWDANLSAFSMWVIIGYLLTKIEMKIPAFLKGIVISVLILIPTAIIIGWQEPFSLIPITIMTMILGSILGILIKKTTK